MVYKTSISLSKRYGWGFRVIRVIKDFKRGLGYESDFSDASELRLKFTVAWADVIYHVPTGLLIFQVLDVNNKCRGRGLFWGDKKIVLSRDKTILVNLKSIPWKTRCKFSDMLLAVQVFWVGICFELTFVMAEIYYIVLWACKMIVWRVCACKMIVWRCVSRIYSRARH